MTVFFGTEDGPAGQKGLKITSFIENEVVGVYAEELPSGVSAMRLISVPPGGLASQVLAKVSDDDGDYDWADAASGGGSGTVTSVSVLTANGLSGSVANPTTTPAITLSISNAGTVRTALGLGTAALNNTGDFDAAGLASAALVTAEAYADAKVSDTAYNDTTWNGVTTIAPSKNAVRDYLTTLGSAAFTSSSAYDAAGAAAAAQAASQPLDSDLTAIAALATDSFGRGTLTQTSAANFRTYIGAGVGGGDALTTNPLSQFAATTSAQLAGVLSDETGTGLAVFNTSPTFTGVPLAPTAAPGTNTTQLATTAFVTAAVTASGGAVGANPSASIAGPAINGVATTYMRSDAVPALAPIITQQQTIQVSDSVTAISTVAMILDHTTSGTPAAGFGISLRQCLQDSTTASLAALDLITTWTDATHASRKVRTVLQLTAIGGAAEIWRGENSGGVAAIGFLGATVSARLASPDAGTALVTFGLASGTPTFAGANVTGTVPLATLATTVITNANLTGPITSTGNATAVASQTGTGTKFVMDTAPTIVGGLHTAITSLGIRSTGAAFDLTLASSEVFTAGRTLTVVMGNAARTLTFTANASIGGTSSGTNTGDQTTITGNAGSATVLATARAINGVNFDGSAAITVTADAGTLTGTTLAATVVSSSLTSVGTLASLQMSGTANFGTQAPGINTAFTHWKAFGANTSFPVSLAGIYDASFVYPYFILNGQLTGGTAASPTFTTGAGGGTFIRDSRPTGGLQIGKFANGSAQAGVVNYSFLDNGSVLLGPGSVATNATDGFPYIPTCAGAKTGTPTATTGMAPIVIDTTNGKLWSYYGGAWHFVTLT